MPEPQDPNTQSNPDEQQEPQSLSLLGGVAQADDLDEFEDLDDAGQSKWSGRGATVLLLVLVLVGAGLLYGMRSMQGDLSQGVAGEVELKIERALAKLNDPENMSEDDPLRPTNLTALFESTEAAVSMFAADLTEQQVPVEYIKQNPFTFSDSDAPAATNRDGAREQWRQDVQQQAGRLNLQSVTRGQRGPIAIIDGQFVRPGEQVGPFLVTEIKPEQLKVELQAENAELDVSHAVTLDMQQQREQRGRR